MFGYSGKLGILGIVPMVRLSCVRVIWVCCCLMFIVAEGQNTHPNEVTALEAIKKSFTDRNKNLRNWNRGDPCSMKWNGVLCFNMTLQDGHLHVRELRLLNLNLSGSLSPELGKLSYLQILDVMWNEISGSLPREIGSIVSLKLLLVNGNKLTGPLPEEIGYLLNLDRIQIDQNQISGEIPKSFANLNKTRHFHMNNNSLSGPIPPELSRLENLVHLLLDNNNLSGYLPPELAQLPNLRILQLDNNHFDGSTIPPSYGNMSHLLKLSLRNCSLQGPIPDLSKIPDLAYLDLSSNQLDGPIPTATLSEDMTTIDLSNNQLTGGIPANFSGLPHLQRLSLSNNLLSGSVPFTIWQNRTFNETERLILDFQNNRFSDISGIPNVPQNVTLSLQGNPLCSNSSLIQFCGSRSAIVISRLENSTNSNDSCPPQSCPPHYELASASIVSCYCAAPLLVGYRLKSPGFDDFNPYVDLFYEYLSSRLNINRYQLDLDSFKWQKGPRLSMNLKIFPLYEDNKTVTFDRSELLRIMSMFAGWTIRDSNTFGPYELINFTLLHPNIDVIPSTTSRSSLSKGAIAGIVVGALAGAAVVSLIILRLCARKFRGTSKRRKSARVSIKAGVKSFTYEEMKRAANNFDISSQVGQGGYGKVYHGILADGTEVAIKRAKEGSLQGEKEFLTEIELLSRLHHRNLVSLLGYCDEDGEQMLVYEFMPNGTLRDHLSAKTKEPLSFARRLKLALASAKGILYLHTDADPPIFHRDIKASNILLDSQFTAKVADFGLSILAPVPDIEGILPGHVSTIVKGTPGYLDPEYFQTFKLTDKSDVYSLGVVFLEILTGMQPITHGKNIVRVVNVAYRSGMVFSVIDARMGTYPSDCVERFVVLALKCCQNETDDRPSMSEVVRELENIWHLMPDSDTKMASDTLNSYPRQTLSQETSPSTSKTPCISSDIPGSELVSGTIPNIAPR